MRPSRRLRAVLIPAAGVLLILMAWAFWPAPPSQAGPPGKEVVMTFGPGGVLTRDGGLWQYRLDTQDWVTIEKAFADQGINAGILPLPVPVNQIQSMESFGFILTIKGECWLYDLEDDAWKNIGTPSGR